MSNAVTMRTIVVDMCGSTTVDDNAFPRLLVLVGIMESDSILFNLVVDGVAHFSSLTKCVDLSLCSVFKILSVNGYDMPKDMINMSRSNYIALWDLIDRIFRDAKNRGFLEPD